MDRPNSETNLKSCRATGPAKRISKVFLSQILIDAGFLGLSDQGFEKLGGSYASVKVISLKTTYNFMWKAYYRMC